MQIHLDRALALAREAHEGQTRRHGAPYIQHPAAVKTLVEDIGLAIGADVDDATRAVALLHDVLEDNTVGIDKAEIAARFGADVARGVELLTKTGTGHDATAAYYRNLDAHAGDAVRLVKVCDRLHNLSELHLAPDRAKLAKYVEETREFIIPLAARRPALVAALDDALFTAARAQSALELYTRGADPAARPSSSLPRGIYAIVDGAESNAPRPSSSSPSSPPSSSSSPSSPSSTPASSHSAPDLDELEERVRELVAGGVAMVQLRAKRRTDRELLAMLEVVLGVCRPARVPVIVNDRPDLCVAAGADGVHVGQTDLPPLVARRIVGDVAFVGASTHYERDFDAACAEGGADHVAVGPVFASTTKSGHAPVVGVDALQQRVGRARFPVVAIGGVTNVARVVQCAKAGVHLVAAVSALKGPSARVMCRRMALAFAAARVTT